MPARAAAARVEQVAKKGRTATPPDHQHYHRSATPSSALNGTPAPEENEEPQKPAAPPLPTSIQPGKPLPTVEDPQPEDLPPKDYQSLQERYGMANPISLIHFTTLHPALPCLLPLLHLLTTANDVCCSGVLAESLSRSRQRWISDGLFEKYWTKPTKKRGVIHEDAKNPPKDSMAKVGQVTISLEPHYFEATMYAVKDPNKPAQQSVSRPIIQYGPPNGAMPPPPTPLTKQAPPPTASAPAQAPNAPPPAASAIPPTAASPPKETNLQPPATSTPSQPPPPPLSSALHAAPGIAPARVPTPPKPMASPRGMESVLMPHTAPHTAPPRPANVPPPLAPHVPKPLPSPSAPAAGPSFAPPGSNRSPAPIAAAPTPPQGAPRAAPPQARPAAPVPGTDPIIVTLAEKANEDPQLRDLMKRVANGNAPKDELARFQAIIDQITAESKRKGASQGPSAERLFVDGKTVRYFADEVDVIVSIVLRTNPKQTSADLTPPPNSNPLVVELVKTALDDAKTMDRVRRISQGTPEFSDATDLKETLERLKSQLTQQRPQSAGSSKANGTSNGQHQSPAIPQAPQPAPQQALRSKGPPPVVKPDVSAVAFEFAGGNGDRYLFPKFSIVEQVQTPLGPQVIASFLIVRKGSASEYGGDPKLDYYQPVTIRISSTQPRHLEYFTRVVAPQDEVRRYMEDIMDNMTRAEYVLLAMRLPKPEKEPKEDGQAPEKEHRPEESKNATPDVEDRDVFRKGLTWKKDKVMKLLAKPALPSNSGRIVGEEESYQSFIASVSRKRTEEEE